VPSGEKDGPNRVAPAGAVTTRVVVPAARSSTSIAVASTVYASRPPSRDQCGCASSAAVSTRVVMAPVATSSVCTP
jgi:hypothetical protein